jgi:dipeptidyl aminopeptidase/acylaminoacyl peptidase
MKHGLVLGLLAALPALGAERHPFTFNDMIAMERLSAPAPSPDGKQVAFVATSYSLEENRGNADLWIVSSDGTNLRRLTTHPSSDTNPVFSPDGKTLYFVSARSGTSQIHALPLDGGEAVQVTKFPIDVSTLKLSPDGHFFSFTAAVHADQSNFEKVAERAKKKKDDTCTAMVYERLFVRHWDAWDDGTWSHVCIMPVSGGAPVDIMAGVEGECPSRPFGGPEEYAWSPDSKKIAYVTKVGRDSAWTTNLDIYLYDIAAKTTVNLTAENRAADTAPCFAPSGTVLYYLAMKKPGYESDRCRLMQLDLATGAREDLTEKIEVSWSDLAVAPDGATIYCLGEKEARVRVFAIAPAGGTARELVSEHYNQSLVLGKEALYFLQDSLTSPAELFRYDLAGRAVRRLTGTNDAKLERIAFSAPEEFWFENRDKIKVRGWLLRPAAGFDPAKKYPLAFLVHGGPQGSWEDHFHYRWNLQILPGQGYVAVAIDFRGSTGYGDAFREAITNHWGDRPFNDLMDGLAYVLKAYPFIDGECMAALGASYGGYMVNWIAGNAPDRFRCLVNHDGIFDEHAAYYSTDELWFPEHEHGGAAFERPERYDEFSPMRFVKNWKTPMLVIHGGKDYRLVDTEGISTFTALQRKGIPSKLIYFPTESHFVLSPRNSEFWHRSVIEWLDRWCK